MMKLPKNEIYSYDSSIFSHFRAQIAKALKHKRYGFVFGCNTFLALLIETILTLIVVDKAGLGVDVQTQVYH